METATLDDFMALNDQLAALSQAGLPLAVDLGRDHGEVVARLEKINALVARRVSQGATLAQGIEAEDQNLSPSYRGLIQMGLKSGDLSIGQRESAGLAACAQQTWHTLGIALVYPAVVVGMAFIGLVGFCLFLAPVLDRTYRGLDVPVGGSLYVLDSLRRTLPFWALIPPLGLVTFAITRRRRSFAAAAGDQRSGIFRLPAITAGLNDQRAAAFAESLGRLLECGADLPEALCVAADTWNDGSRAQATRAVAAALRQGQPPSAQSHLVTAFPPFLRWALLDSEPTCNRPQALRMAAGIYHRSARRRLERLRLVAPIAAAVIFGGGATLLYALALFLPVVEMLRGLGR